MFVGLVASSVDVRRLHQSTLCNIFARESDEALVGCFLLFGSTLSRAGPSNKASNLCLQQSTIIVSNNGGAYPWRRRFNLADLDSAPPKEVLSLELTALRIVPLIAPSKSSWTAGGMGVVAPISATAWASGGQGPLISGQGRGIGVLRSY